MIDRSIVRFRLYVSSRHFIFVNCFDAVKNRTGETGIWQQLRVEFLKYYKTIYYLSTISEYVATRRAKPYLIIEVRAVC